jgi:hypothetical protein
MRNQYQQNLQQHNLSEVQAKQQCRSVFFRQLVQFWGDTAAYELEGGDG